LIIEDVSYRVVFDSRGRETVECEIVAGDVIGRAIAPSGASTGTDEAVVISPYKYEEIEEKIVRAIVGLSIFDQESVDEALHEVDGTDNFSNIGGNFAITASIATARAAAETLGLPLYHYIGGAFAKELPYPLGNVIGGGKHAPGSTSIQEFLVIPCGAKSFFDAQRANAAVHRKIKEILTERGIFAAKGDEGAWAAQINDEQAFEILSEAITSVSDEVGFEIRAGIDVAATELWNGEYYVYGERRLTTEEQISFIAEMIDKYNLLYVEDPLHENDFEGFAELTRQVKCMVCGDDIFVTNVKRIKKGIEMGSANAVLIKPNQIGTLTDTYRAVKIARDCGYEVVVSHRSGETEDESIAHLSIAFNAKLIKTGVVGGERAVKLNELIRIEELMDKSRMVEL
jgi:enolase